jgi:polar amino acid transport system substrate-binding protein
MPKSVVLMILSLLLLPQAAAAESLQGIRERGRLIVAVKDNTRPLGFKGTNGQLQGLEIDIARRLGQEIFGKSDPSENREASSVENRVDLQPVKNQERLRVLLDGKVDLTIARLSVNNSRARVVDFSRPYYRETTGIVTNSPGIRQVQDLAQKRVAVIQGSSTALVMNSRLSQAKLVPVASYQAAKDLLDRRQVEAFATDKSLVVGWVQEYPQYRLVAPNLTVTTLKASESIAIAMPRGRKYDPLWRFIEKTLQKWQKEGWLQARIRYWGL